MTKEKSEKQKMWEEVRHIVSSKHQVPDHVDEGNLILFLWNLKGITLSED